MAGRYLLLFFFIFHLQIFVISTNEELGGKELILYGKHDDLSNFTGISEAQKENLTHLELSYVHFEPEFLLESLRGCQHLETLILRRLENSQWQFGKSRVVLPSLKFFSIDIKYQHEDISEGKFKSLLFFDTNATLPCWTFGEIHKLKVDITVSQFSSYEDHSNIFRINHSEGLLESRLRFIGLLLNNLPNDFKLKKLGVHDASVDLRWIPTTITHLEFSRVIFEGGNLSSLVKIPANLEQLALISIGDEEALDISNFPYPSLRKLTLISVSNLTMTRIVPFPKLTTFKYYFSPIPMNLIEFYAQLFPWVKYVDSRLTYSTQSLTLLRNILKTCAQMISLFDFSWGKYCDPARSDQVDSGMVRFLLDSGVESCSSYFRLTKNGTSGQWNSTDYSAEYDASFSAGISVPDWLPGEGELEDCGKINSYDWIEETPNTEIPHTEMPDENNSVFVNPCPREGSFPDEEDCRRFHHCVRAASKTDQIIDMNKICEAGTLFDVYLGLCVSADEAWTHPTCTNIETTTVSEE